MTSFVQHTAHEYRAARYPTSNGHGLHFIILQIVSLVQLNLFVSTSISRAEPWLDTTVVQNVENIEYREKNDSLKITVT